MRLRPSFWIVLGLLLLAGIWLFWPALTRRPGANNSSAATQNQAVATPGVTVTRTSASTAPQLFTTAKNATNAVSAPKTNPFPYRLSNTTKSLGELAGDRHAILLENALIDTGAKLNLAIPKNLRTAGDPGAYIVQARGPIDANFRAALAAAGAEIISYIPNNAYLVRATPAGAQQLAALAQSVIPYEPYYKLTPSLLAALDKNQPVSELKVAAYPGAGDAAVAALEKAGMTVTPAGSSPFGPVFTVQNVTDIAKVAQMPLLPLIEPVHQRVHANDLSRQSIGVAVDSTTATNYLGLDGLNVLVQVNDSGIDATHPDLVGRVFPATQTDTDGHGTHVAGIIAGDGTESMTVTNASGSINPGTNFQYRGMAPKASLISHSWGGSDQLLQESAALTNALISNNSWNYAGDNAYDLAAASYDAATRDALTQTTGSQPVLFVFSAGNAGGGNTDGGATDPDTVLSPGTAKNVITVGALEQLRNITNEVVDADGNTNAVWKADTDSSFEVANFSSRGNVGVGTESTNGRCKPDVVAPGTFVVSTRSGQWDEAAYYSPTNYEYNTYTDQTVTNGGLNQYQIDIPGNAVAVSITIVSNKFSPVPFPTNLPIYVEYQDRPPNPPTLPPVDFVGLGSASIPPGGGSLTDISSVQNDFFYYAVGNTNSFPVSYDLITVITTTNDQGNYFEVLSNLNDSLSGGPPPYYYRYESGTSMAAADVSGVLALMQGFFTNNLLPTPSPALLKAMLINGARVTGNYTYNPVDSINSEGWGKVNLPNSLPPGVTNLTTGGGTNSFYFLDQSPTNALATGDSQTFMVTVDTNFNTLPLRVTLAWTDPAGNPAAAIKLVNNLDLVVTNLDTGEVFFGNDIPAGGLFNSPWSTNSPQNFDTINNIENVFLAQPVGANYSVTVVGREVNVNAVTAQTNNPAGVFAPNVVQDYALVVSHGDGTAPGAITVAPMPVAPNLTAGQLVTFVTSTNTPLLNQLVGANTPLMGTNTIGVGTNTTWGTNGAITLGMTNQWHFYVVTNVLGYPYAAFITFVPATLSVPRTGVYADSADDSTQPEADIDLYVADPHQIPNSFNLTNLDPAVISAADKSLSQGGVEFVTYSNSVGGDVYYIGVKSETQEGSEYGFIPIFSQTPFSQTDANGNEYVQGVPLPVNIPDGTTVHPGKAYIFAIATTPIDVERVVVTNTIFHENFGDLIGTLSHGGKSVVMNNHIGEPVPGTYTKIYDDSGRGDHPGSQPSTGPGSLTSFQAQEGIGPWILTEVDDSQSQTGAVTGLSLFIEKHQKLTDGITVDILPGTWFYTFVDVPPGYTNLSVFATNLPPTVTPPLELYLDYNVQPDRTNYLDMAFLTNGTPPGNVISYGPPLRAGTYYVGIFNPSLTTATAYLIAKLSGLGQAPVPAPATTNGPALLDDAVSSSTVYVSSTQQVASVNVGVVVNHPRISDLTFTLLSPTGQRVLLMENRGASSTNGAGDLFITTNNFAPVTANGGGLPQTNYLDLGQTSGSFLINWDFLGIADQMTVYYGTNSADFTTNLPNPNLLFDSGFVSGTGATNLIFGPGTSTFVTIIMNQFGNSAGADGTAWTYTVGGVQTNYNYLMFTDDTNLTTVPIKYAVPPFVYTAFGTNYTLSDFDLATNGDYLAPTNIYDAFGGWSLTNITSMLVGTNLVFVTNNANMVSVVTDPAIAAGGSNFLALANGRMFREIPMTPGRQFSLSFQYRGPGISGWWRGEGDATDSSDPENNGNNGELIGRFNFPAGEVGQAFEMQDAGDQFQFAGTNTYVQIHQPPVAIRVAGPSESNSVITVLSSPLDVGTGSGFTVEGWINPTNVSFQQPLVEWLTRTPTNLAGTNVVITAGPFLNPATGHYYYMLGSTNWTTSEAWATQIGGHLVTIETANEQNWVYDTFANYNFINRNLWIGLNNAANPTNFVWSSGLTNPPYFNWLTGQPTNCSGTDQYTMMLGATNGLPGLWMLADDAGHTCNYATNKNYGVVEVDELQPNGVQFWISVTNAPGTTNVVAITNGCLFANLVDTTNGSHIIYSAPGLVQTNVYQHVALTYNTNSGIASLYYNGTNVATTNFGVSFVPNTTGDVLLGKDMSRLTNNFYGGKMDEMSIYGRTLSDAEIAAIYNISFLSTNRSIGKFDPSITPALGLAEAQVSLGAFTNVILGLNNSWQSQNFSFAVTTNSSLLQIIGLEPGMLLDSFNVSEQPLGNLYYFPEQPLETLKGSSANGTWTLQILDNRTGAYLTNSDQLVNWQLQIVLQNNALPSVAVGTEEPTTISVPPGEIVDLTVAVPTWATAATNVLVSSTLPVDLLFNQTNAPTGSPADYTLLTGLTVGIGNPDLTTAPSVPPLLPGQTYHLGVRNPGTHSATVVIRVDFDITALSNGVPVDDVLTTNANDTERYFVFNVSSNAYEATFQLLHLTGNADLVIRKGTPLPTLTSSDYGSFTSGNVDEAIYVLTNSLPVPLAPGPWYLGVFRRDAGPVSYTVLAKELDAATPPNIIPLTNGVPFTFTAGPGAALTNFFSFTVTNNPSLTNNPPAIHFEVYNQSGNGDLTVQTNALPLAPPFFRSSQQPGSLPEFIFIQTNSAQTNLSNTALTNLNQAWYLGVPNHETNPITYTILAVIDTNNVFPAFPGAEGAGGGAMGGGHAFPTNNGSVYHVVNLNDSGAGSLRDAVSTTNRTVVFDVAGTINLQAPLVITNSYLTIAGQTSPGGGVTVAGQMTTVQSAHDVIIRSVRFRPGNGTNASVVWSNGFEGQNQTFDAVNYFSGGWHVDSGNVDLLTTGFNGAQAYEGTNFLDLNGDTAGTISTNVPTVVGKSYALSFVYTMNPAAGITNAAANVFQNGNLLLALTVNSTNQSWPNIVWATASATFTATTPTTQIQFVSQSPNSAGVVLDAVSLSATGSAGDSLQFLNASNVIADHVSTSWSSSDLVSVLNSSNVTVQWSIMADSLYLTNNPAPLGSSLRYGGGALSFHHNLYADNYAGSPRLGDNLSLDFVNNVIYGWGTNAGFTLDDITNNPSGFTNRLNYVCNYLIVGNDSFAPNIAFRGGTTNTWIFQTNNFIDSNTNGSTTLRLDGANTGWNMFTNQFTPVNPRFPLPPVATDEAYQAYERVLDFAGVNLTQRDPVDVDIVTEVRNQTGRLISTPPSLGLIGWWKGDGDAVDSVAGNNGTLVNGTYTAGVVNQAFSFNSGGYTGVQIADKPAYALTNSLTIEGWVRPHGNNSYEIFWRGDHRPGFDPYSLSMQGNSNVLFFIGDALNNSASVQTSLAYNQWTHLAATLDGGTGTMSLYTNGILAAQTVTAIRPFGALQAGQSPGIGIGNVNDGGNNFPFFGDLDEISLYKRALSQSEIQSIYNAGSAGKYSVAPAMLPFLDTDQDGAPDFWETTFGQNPTNYDSYLQTTNVNYLGYSALEEYLAWLGVPHALTVTNTAIGVDLYQLSGNSGKLSFLLTNAINGTVYLTNVLNNTNSLGIVTAFTNTGPFSNRIAVFTPSNNYSGYASFDYFVTNNDTIAYFGPVKVSVVVSSIPIVYGTINTNPPVFVNGSGTIASQTTNELTLLTVTNTATEANTNLTLSYTVSMSIDTAAMNLLGLTNTYANITNTAPVISANGIITWTPTEAQGPGVYIITTIVSDSGVPSLSATNSFTVTVNEMNQAPFWPTNVPSQTNYSIGATTTLIVTNTASDLDIPTNTLTYQLSGPTNAVIDTNGIITWTPTATQLGLFTFTTIVTDTNPPAVNAKSLSNTNTFTVNVTPVSGPFVFTEPAQLVTGTSAQLNGMVTPNGLPTTAWFEWGTNTTYGNQTPPVTSGNGYNVVYTTNNIGGLTLNVPYHFRVVAANAAGTNYGFDQILDEANVVVWGADYVNQANVPAGLSNVVAIAGAYDHSLGLKNDGTAMAWGDNTFNQSTVPGSLNSNLLAVAGGEYYSMVLKNTGTVASWGANVLTQTNVPAGLSNVVLIAGGTYSSLALKNDGAIVVWGANIFGLPNVPSNASNSVAVAGGGFHSLAIKNDGTVVAWGDNSAGQTNMPAGLSNVVAISAGNYHSLALKYDGTVVAWGDNSAGQTNVPAGLSNVVAVAAGGFHSMALQSDGKVVTWGDNSSGQSSVPPNLTNVVAIASGYFHSLALTPQSLASLTNPVVLNLTNGVSQTGTVVAGGITYYQVNVPANADFATNILFTLNANQSLNLWFTTNAPPTIATNASLLLPGVTNGLSVLSTSGAPTNIVPGTTYYLGVQNTNTFPVSYGIEVDFHQVVAVAPPISSIIYTNIGGQFGFLLTWFAPSNELFQVQWTGGLPVTNWNTFTNIVSYNTNVFTSPTNTQFNFFDDGSQTGGFGPQRFYRLILLGSARNTPPAFSATPATQAINPLSPLSVTNAATDSNVPAQTLTYALLNPPAGATINSSNGVITWTPTLAQAGTSNIVTTIVTDNGTPNLSATNSFAVLVNPIPVINSVAFTNILGTPGFLVRWYAPTNDRFQVQWTANLAPANWQTFSNIVVYTGALTPTNGLFTFFDDGSQTGGLGMQRFYRLILLGTGVPANTLALPGQTNFTVSVSTLVTVTNTATDSNTNAVLTYSLVNPPTNAAISTNGIITWTNATPNGLAARFTTLVTDNGVPPASATNTFTIFVAPLPSITNVTVTATNVVLSWSAPTNDQFNIRWTTNLVPPTVWTWFPGTITSPSGSFSFTDTNAPLLMKFYQLILLP